MIFCYTNSIKQFDQLTAAVDVQLFVRLFEITAHRINGKAGILGDLPY